MKLLSTIVCTSLALQIWGKLVVFEIMSQNYHVESAAVYLNRMLSNLFTWVLGAGNFVILWLGGSIIESVDS